MFEICSFFFFFFDNLDMLLELELPTVRDLSFNVKRNFYEQVVRTFKTQRDKLG